MIQKPVESITKSDIDTLVANAVTEVKTLEYKEALPGATDEEKREFLADISSMANASGGDIIYGISAAVDDAGKKTGSPGQVQPITDWTVDQAKLRLEEMILNGIKPRVRVQVKAIAGWGADGSSYIILVRIPRSFASPHMVTFKGLSRFYSRHSAGKYPLDVAEIRSAFLATETQGERVKRFIEDRLGQIVGDETPVRLASPHRWVLHMFSLGPFLNNERLDLAKQDELNNAFKPIGASAWNNRHNLDGFLTWEGEFQKGQGHAGYCQLFRNGVLEAITADVLKNGMDQPTRGGVYMLDSASWEHYLVSALTRFLSGFRSMGQSPPIVIALALLGCKGSYLLHYGSHPIDRNVAVFPNVVMDDYDADIPTAMRPIFDAVCNAGGCPRSWTYDQNGKWKP